MNQPTSTPVSERPPRGRFVLRWPWRRLEGPRHLFDSVTPNWYASIMGTGIVANAAATLPLHFPGLRAWATAVWGLASVLLVLLTIVTCVHWAAHPDRMRGYFAHPVMAPFFGAPPMAFLTVGCGTLLLGQDVIGTQAAVIVSAVLWTLGTLLGLACVGYITHATFTRMNSPLRTAFGGWLMPVVPPMVSAASGAVLIPHLPAGEPRLVMLLSCYAMFGASLVAALVIIGMLWAKLLQHGVGEVDMVPTLWIVLGPLGQSITAASVLGDNAHLAVSEPTATAFEVFGVVYGVPVLGFALLWAGIAAAITVRALRDRMPFSLTWWSFTFPVGTCVTGASGLALHTGSVSVAWLAEALYVALVAAWVVVAARTFHDSVVTGRLLALPHSAR